MRMKLNALNNLELYFDKEDRLEVIDGQYTPLDELTGDLKKFNTWLINDIDPKYNVGLEDFPLEPSNERILKLWNDECNQVFNLPMSKIVTELMKGNVIELDGHKPTAEEAEMIANLPE